MSIYILGTLDTKGIEVGFVRERLAAVGIKSVVVDVGCLGEPVISPDITRDALFAAGGFDLEEIRARNDRGHAVTAATESATKLISHHFSQGAVSGVIALGGSAGTTIASAAMRAIPVGVPKVMVSTLASGDVRKFVGDKDILMINSIVDILGLNRISRVILGNAAHAIAGMVTHAESLKSNDDKPLIAATMFGVTTPCVERAKAVLEQAGYEVLVFHATGNGGAAMESLIRDGVISGVLDVTTTELADELVGGFLSAGPDRLRAAGEVGVPQVVSVGATDMVNFWGMESVPQEFRERKLYVHNPTITLMRTTAEESSAIGRDIGTKVAIAKGPSAIFLPTRGVSAIDAEGQPFEDIVARTALFKAIEESSGNVEVQNYDCHINDNVFAEAMANKLLELIQSTKSIV